MQKIPFSKVNYQIFLNSWVAFDSRELFGMKNKIYVPSFTRTTYKLNGLHGDQPLLFQYINSALKNYHYWAFIIFSRYETRGVDQCFSLWFRGDARNFHVKFFEHDKNGETTKLLKTCSGEDFIFFKQTYCLFSKNEDI